MTSVHDKFFQLLQLAIGSSSEPPKIEKGEWNAIYEIAKKQSLVALLFDGIQKMSDVTKTQGGSPEMDVDLLMTWMGKSKQTEKRNRRLDEAVGKASAWFEKKGVCSCLLKGQGNALMYPCPGHRTPGDIDIWVSGEPSEVIRFVHAVAPKEKASYHHIDFPAIDGIPVEVHYRPCYLQNPLHNYRLQRFFTKSADRQFSHFVDIGGNQVAIPTPKFNAVFQLAHIYNHLFQEGIGLRQIIDYYYVMTNTEGLSNTDDSILTTNSTNSTNAGGANTDGDLSNTNCTNLTNAGGANTDDSILTTNCTNNTNIAALQLDLKRLGLWRFAGAVMWVLHEALGLPASRMIAPMDEKRGRLLLDEILSGGNFGQYSSQQHFERGTLAHNVQRLRRDLRLVRLYPAEALAEPFFRAWHFFWRLGNRAL